MPIYSYKCSDCEEKFDKLVGVTSETVELKCPNCGSKKIKKALATFSVQAKSEESTCLHRANRLQTKVLRQR